MIKALAQACIRLLWMITLAKCKIPDAQVTCLFSEDCVLPCSFTPSGNDIIHWYRQEKLILSYSQGKDQPEQSHLDHSTRMYLLQDRLSGGDASLHLRHCGIKDRGRYRCQINNTTLGHQESFVIMKVEAPVRMVTMEMSKDRMILCLSKDIFPAPRVQWSTLPPRAFLKSTTHMAPSSEGLYSIQSQLRTLEDNPTYICTINSSYGSQSWRSSLKERELIGEGGADLSIPCIAPQNLQNFSLTWTFTRITAPTVILRYDSRTRQTSNLWEGRAGLEQDQVLKGIGSLLLHNPESQEHTGTYTCTFSALQSTYMVQTQVTIRPTSQPLPLETGKSPSMMWVIAVVVAVVALLVTALLLYRKKRANQRKPGRATVEDTEMQPMETSKESSEATVAHPNTHPTVKPADESPLDNCQLTADNSNGHS